MRIYRLLFLFCIASNLLIAMDGGAGAGRDEEREKYVAAYDDTKRVYQALLAIIGSECMTKVRIGDGGKIETHNCTSAWVPHPLQTAQELFDKSGETVVDCFGMRRGYQLLVSYEEHTPVGLIGYKTKQRKIEWPFSYDSGAEAKIYLLAVAEKHQRRGHAKLLIEAALNKANQDGVRRTMIAYPSRNKAVAALCEKTGFDVRPSLFSDSTVCVFNHERLKKE